MQEDKKEDKKEKKEEKKDEKDLSSRQAIAVLGIALIAMGEEIGSEMAFRTFGHLVSRLCGILIDCQQYLQNLCETEENVDSRLFEAIANSNIICTECTMCYVM